MDKNKNKVDTPLRKIEWLAEFMNGTKWAAYHAIRTKRVPEWCVVKMGGQIRVNEAQVRHWANGGKAPLDLNLAQ